MYYRDGRTVDFEIAVNDLGRVLDIGTGVNREQQQDSWPITPEEYLTVDVSKDAGPEIVANCAALPFDSDSFDLVFLESVLEHMRISEVEPSIREVRRVLRPGGVIAGWVPFCYPHHGSSVMRDDLRWTAAGLRGLLSDFDNVEIEPCGGPLSILLVNIPVSLVRSLRQYIEPIETRFRHFLPDSHPDSVSAVGYRFHAYDDPQ